VAKIPQIAAHLSPLPPYAGSACHHGRVPEFRSYFHQRSTQFARFYQSEPVARLLGRGPLFDRLRFAVEQAEAVGAQHVLDVGCGSGPLFAPLVSRGIRVTGIDPAPNMVALARAKAAHLPSGMAEVQQRGWEDLLEIDTYDMAVALGVFDYVDSPAELLRRMSRAAPHAVGSFPAPGLRTNLRKLRYARGGVSVHGYRPQEIVKIAGAAGLRVAARLALNRAGHAVRFSRP
jgi:2-polyprenyl-6-hydroxyphenyl methylase/3-demethylubiquinone-9 3-methyltransferase